MDGTVIRSQIKKQSMPAARSRYARLVSQDDPNSILKKGIWLYFLLLIFEGALRKWVVPALSNPLLVVRDPLALWLIIMAYSRNMIYLSSYLIAMVCFGI